MKKYRFLVIVWIFMVMVNVSSKTEEINYTIYFDSKDQNEYQIKEKIVEQYQILVDHVSAASKNVLINKNLEKFQLEDNYIVAWKNNKLLIKIGDASGSKIEGMFEELLCTAKVEPRSWIMEMIK